MVLEITEDNTPVDMLIDVDTDGVLDIDSEVDNAFASILQDTSANDAAIDAAFAEARGEPTSDTAIDMAFAEVRGGRISTDSMQMSSISGIGIDKVDDTAIDAAFEEVRNKPGLAKEVALGALETMGGVAAGISEWFIEEAAGLSTGVVARLTGEMSSAEGIKFGKEFARHLLESSKDWLPEDVSRFIGRPETQAARNLLNAVGTLIENTVGWLGSKAGELTGYILNEARIGAKVHGFDTMDTIVEEATPWVKELASFGTELAAFGGAAKVAKFAVKKAVAGGKHWLNKSVSERTTTDWAAIAERDFTPDVAKTDIIKEITVYTEEALPATLPNFTQVSNIASSLTEGFYRGVMKRVDEGRPPLVPNDPIELAIRKAYESGISDIAELRKIAEAEIRKKYGPVLTTQTNIDSTGFYRNIMNRVDRKLGPMFPGDPVELAIIKAYESGVTDIPALRKIAQTEFNKQQVSPQVQLELTLTEKAELGEIANKAVTEEHARTAKEQITTDVESGLLDPTLGKRAIEEIDSATSQQVKFAEIQKLEGIAEEGVPGARGSGIDPVTNKQIPFGTRRAAAKAAERYARENGTLYKITKVEGEKAYMLEPIETSRVIKTTQDKPFATESAAKRKQSMLAKDGIQTKLVPVEGGYQLKVTGYTYEAAQARIKQLTVEAPKTTKPEKPVKTSERKQKAIEEAEPPTVVPPSETSPIVPPKEQQAVKKAKDEIATATENMRLYERAQELTNKGADAVSLLSILEREFKIDASDIVVRLSEAEKAIAVPEKWRRSVDEVLETGAC